MRNSYIDTVCNHYGSVIPGCVDLLVDCGGGGSYTLVQDPLFEFVVLNEQKLKSVILINRSIVEEINLEFSMKCALS